MTRPAGCGPWKLFLLLFLLTASPAWADGLKFGEDWTAGDTARQIAVTALMIVDWGQTRYIVKNPCGPYEHCVNPLEERGPARYFIGNHPSLGQVNVYFAASVVLNAGIAYALPRGWRDAWQYLSAGRELYFTIDNHSAGIEMSFPW